MSQPTLFGSGFLKKKTSETTGEELTKAAEVYTYKPSSRSDLGRRRNRGAQSVRAGRNRGVRGPRDVPDAVLVG